jgi:hypothetical protein
MTKVQEETIDRTMEELSDERMALFRWYRRGVFPPVDLDYIVDDEEMKKQSSTKDDGTGLVR